MAIDDIFLMKSQPGVIVLGENVADERQVYEDLIRKLSEFYASREKVFVSKEFRFSQDVYYCPVYLGEVPDTGKGEKPIQLGCIKIEIIEHRMIYRYVKEWDFPHAPQIIDQQVFAVYFNLLDNVSQASDRDDFLRYARGHLAKNG